VSRETVRLERVNKRAVWCGSISTRYGSGSFCHQAKIVRKPLIRTVFWLLYDYLPLKNYVNVASKSKNQKKNQGKNHKNSRIRIRTRTIMSRIRTLQKRINYG
jgi:hypothetical protein